MIEGDGCEVTKVGGISGIDDEKALELTDEIVVAGEVTLADWDDIGIDVTMLLE